MKHSLSFFSFFFSQELIRDKEEDEDEEEKEKEDEEDEDEEEDDEEMLEVKDSLLSSSTFFFW